MSSGTAPPQLPPQSPPPADTPVSPQASPLEDLIEDRIHKTQLQVKGVDIISRLMALVTGALAYLFVVALIDQWFVAGGLGFTGRFFFWTILVLASALFFIYHLWPAIAR